MIATINPYTNNTEKIFQPISSAEIQIKVQKANEAFVNWKNTTREQRIELFENLITILQKRKRELAILISTEMGKLIAEAVTEIDKSITNFRYYIGNSEMFLQDEPVELEYGKGLLIKEPVGIILAVMPWNFPFWQVYRFAAPALLAGNVALLKHASNVPQCSLMIEQIFIDAGFPAGVFQSLLIEAKQVDEVIENDLIKAVTLTGSEKAGAHVASKAASQIKKAVLELGGSDAFVVMEDADMKKAISTAVKSRLINCGQSCIAAKRFIVHEKVSEAFCKGLKDAFTNYQLGNPLDTSTTLAPLAKKELVDDLEKQISISVKMGAKILCGGKRLNVSGNYFEPTIVIDVKPDMPVFNEETFGPIAAIVTFKTNDEAVDLANNTRFGLGGSVWTENREQGLMLAKKINSGSVYVNHLMKSDSRLPFGGINKSGFGKELSQFGFNEWMNIKSVVIA